MTDVDVDGAHTDITSFFFVMQENFSAGALYIAQPPLYLIRQGKGEFMPITIKNLTKN